MWVDPFKSIVHDEDQIKGSSFPDIIIWDDRHEKDPSTYPNKFWPRRKGNSWIFQNKLLVEVNLIKIKGLTWLRGEGAEGEKTLRVLEEEEEEVVMAASDTMLNTQNCIWRSCNFLPFFIDIYIWSSIAHLI